MVLNIYTRSTNSPQMLRKVCPKHICHFLHVKNFFFFINVSHTLLNTPQRMHRTDDIYFLNISFISISSTLPKCSVKNTLGVQIRFQDIEIKKFIYLFENEVSLNMKVCGTIRGT